MSLINNHINSREIAAICAFDVRTVNKHIFATLEALGHTLSDTKDGKVETYGEFQILRVYSTTGRLLHVLINEPMTDLIRTRFDVVSAYKLQQLLKGFINYGGLIVNQLRNRYSPELIIQGLLHIGLVENCEHAKSGYRFIVENSKNASGLNEAYFIKVPKAELVKSDNNDDIYITSSESRTLFVYGQTAKKLMEYLIEHEVKHRELYFSEI